MTPSPALEREREGPIAERWEGKGAGASRVRPFPGFVCGATPLAQPALPATLGGAVLGGERQVGA